MTSLKRSNEQSIFLVGFMACGKSTVGAALAAKLSLPFIDLDHQIETSAGCSIHELIINRGEADFRRIESEALARVATSASVIATGGGVILSAANRQLMSANGTTIWLDAPFELCWERISRSRSIRPLAPDRDAALGRYQDRRSFYAEAQLRVETNAQLSADEVAAIIVKLLNSR